MMLTLEHDRTCIETGDTGWISNRNDVRDFPSDLQEASQNPANGAALFASLDLRGTTFAERFPRLTVCAVAAVILLTAVTAEIEWLRGSGYFWR